MTDFINNFTQNIVNYMQFYGIWFGFLIIILESIIPCLPLFLFIGLNIASYGMIFGFIISWLATVCGCILSYTFFRILAKNKLKKVKNKQLIKIIKAIENIDFSNLVLIIALPFTPAFLVNIACGLTKINFKKFLMAVLIGKVSIIYFWGFIGTSLIESITDTNTIISICLLLLIAYIVSKIVSKKFNIE